jgi:hypothetical protein
VSFDVIDVASPFLASRRICFPVSVSCAPSIDANFCLTSLLLTFSSAEPLESFRTFWMNCDVVSLRPPWTMTSND